MRFGISWALCGMLATVLSGCDQSGPNRPAAKTAKVTKQPAAAEHTATAVKSQATEKPATVKTEATEPATVQSAGTSAAGQTAVQLSPAEIIMPPVLMTDEHAKTCVVKVGDSMPAVELKDVNGKQQSLSKLLGEKLTVVLFWTGKQPYAVQELTDLEPDVALPYGSQGVNVVAISEGHDSASSKQIAGETGATFPVLVDADGVALAAVAHAKLPRTYLLDGDGKILWFDLEYSRSTRRDLQRAIRFTLSQQ
jgi:peroxiredoxin